MSKLWPLLKANLINTLGINKLRSKTTGKISPLLVVLAVVSVIFLLGLSFFYMMIFGGVFAAQNMPQLILVLGLMAGSFFSFMMTITNANGYLFRSKDFEMLMALPVKQRTVFISKLFHLLVLNYAILIFLYLPTIIVYAIYSQTDVVFWLLALPVFLLMPLFMVTVGGLLSFLIGLVTSRFRHKNLAFIILMLIFTIVIIVVSFQSSVIEENPSQFTQDMKAFLDKIRLGNLMFEALTGNWLKFLAFAGISIIPFTGFVYFTGAVFKKANFHSQNAYVNKKFKMTVLKTSTQNWALLKRELKRYFSSPIYVLNTIIGSVLTTVVLIVMGTDASMVISGIENVSKEMFALIITWIFTFMLGITSTTASTLSIEGKQFWILKSAPISTTQIYHAKIMVNILITIPFIIVDTIIAAFMFDFGLVEMFFMILLPSLMAIYMSYIGLFMNILFPRFDYENETKVVKQSVSVLLTMVCGFFGAALMLVPGIILQDALNNSTLTYLIQTLLGSILAIVAISLLYTTGSKRFKRIVS
jgi:ABC-2 type transport system permease protein